VLGSFNSSVIATEVQMISVSAPVETQAYMLRGVDIEQDAAKLAKMWNDSDDQWPGTVTNGVPMTAAAARKWFEQQKCIDALVWDTGDDIAGYCSFWAKPDEANVTYIAEINIAPAYQGQSLARKLLVHFVERAAAMDSPRLDLNTWSGNLKAVPLYKKCGFCWAPGTSVAMYNFMPAILSLPCAQAFFAQHNWYHAFKRTLTQAEDDERWEGMGVFTYHFEADGDQMTVWVDREARRITAVETATFFAAAIMTDQEPPHGLATVMRWKLTNKRDQPMHIALLASGSADLKLDHQTTLQLAPGESVEIKAEVRIAAQMAPIDAAKPAPTLRSLFVIDGAPLELHTGVRPRLAIEVGADPEYLTLMPGVPQTIHLQLRSNLSETASTTVRLTPTRGLSVDWTQQQVQLDARGFASLPATVQADLHGVLTLPVAASLERAGEHIHLPTISLSIFARPLGAVLAQHSGDKLRIENEHLRLIISQEGGKAEIYRVGTNEYLAEYAGYAAPPTRPNEFRNGRFELTLEQQDGQFIALATMASQEFPGFVLHKRFTVNAGPVIRVAYEFENRSAEQYTRQVYQWLQGDTETAMLTLPLAAGLGRGQ
jgi:ribosomal protein S18 acetylase RimI-like enzyme